MPGGTRVFRMPVVVDQIKSLLKIKDKVPSWFNYNLMLPRPVSIEQASSEHTARFKASLFSGEQMADLTGGTGIDTYFFAQAFKQVDYVEQNPELVERAKYNFHILGRSNIACHAADAAAFLQKNTTRYDLLYLDPARRDLQQRRVIRLEDYHPNILGFQEQLHAQAERVLVKNSSHA